MIDNNMFNGINMTIDIPYPEIKNYSVSEDVLLMLRSVFSGITSELSAVMSYSYIRSLFNKNYELNKLFRTISITEMKHYALLSDFIVQTKNKPCSYFKNEKNNFEPWNSSFINYEQGLLNIVDNSIKSELKTIKKYKSIIKVNKNGDLNNLLARIILDEERHIELLSSLKKNLI